MVLHDELQFLTITEYVAVITILTNILSRIAHSDTPRNFVGPLLPDPESRPVVGNFF